VTVRSASDVLVDVTGITEGMPRHTSSNAVSKALQPGAASTTLHFLPGGHRRVHVSHFQGTARHRSNPHRDGQYKHPAV
jgi:hypothetical protein